MNNKKILVVGAGFSGATIARHLAEAGFQVEVIDKRPHIGGNAYDFVSNSGIRIHKYGPHIFHTNNEKVFNWLSQFTKWLPYQHKVKAQLADGQYVTLPVNKETAEIVGKENVIDTFFRPYTKKMWNKDLEELDPSILQRVPIRDDDNELYFPKDKFQFMPAEGYTKIFENIFDHPNIEVKTETLFDINMISDYYHVFNSMPIDHMFGYCFGRLPYRSIKFHDVVLPSPKLLPTACVNFTHDGPNTRMTEWKNFPNHGENNSLTVITYEEPCDYEDNDFEPYYPVKDIDGKNRQVYRKYRDLIPKKMTFIGRCGLYAYLDMDMAIAFAMKNVQDFIEENLEN